MVGKKAKIGGPSALPDEFNEPIVVPFNGMYRISELEPNPASVLFDHISGEPTPKDLIIYGAWRQLEKLVRLADHYKIDRSDPQTWGLQLALKIANDHHPGFKLVYDDWRARCFHMLFGFTPIFPLKGKKPKRISGDVGGWAKMSKFFRPEFLAMLVNRDRRKGLSDKEFCEILVVAADERMKSRKNGLVKDSRTETLIRRLTEGRKRLKNNGL